MNAREKTTLDRLRVAIAQLKREKFQLLQLIAAAPVGFALLDQNLRFVRINAALKVIDGQLASEHMGQTSTLLPSNRYAAKCLLTGCQFSTFRSAMLQCKEPATRVPQIFTPFVPMVSTLNLGITVDRVIRE
jgi:PAS domain-containing protein